MIVVATIIPQNRIKRAQTCRAYDYKKNSDKLQLPVLFKSIKKMFNSVSPRSWTQPSSARQPKLIVCFHHLMEGWALASRSRKSRRQTTQDDSTMKEVPINRYS